MSKVLKHYKVWLGGMAPYNDVYGYSEKEVREWLRERYNVKRLPAGTYISLFDAGEERSRAEWNERENAELLEANPWLASTDL